MPRAFATTLAVCVLALATAGGAHAAEPRIDGVECIAACADGQARGGSLLLVSGSDLGDVYTAVFPGGRDGIRDLRGRAGQASTTTVRVRVPWEATSGSFVLGTRGGLVSSSRRLQGRTGAGGLEVECIGQCAPGRQIKGGSLLLVRGLRLGAVRDAVLHGARPRGRPAGPRQQPGASAASGCGCPSKAVTGNFSARERRRRSPGRKLTVQARPPRPSPRAPPPACSRSGARTTSAARARASAPAAAAISTRARTSWPSAACRWCRPRRARCTTRATSPRRATTWWCAARRRCRTTCTCTSRTRRSCPRAPRWRPASRSAPWGSPATPQGCHLHFEIWSAPGWYDGGKPFDPLPQLQAWDAAG